MKKKKKNNKITIKYAGQTIFNGTITSDPDAFYINRRTVKKDGRITQVVSLTTKVNKPIVMEGFIQTDSSSFPCSVDRPVQSREIVRHTVGLSHSLLNRAIYDRDKDWVLSIDEPAHIVIQPLVSDSLQNHFKISVTGSQIGIRFRPRYYQKHRGLSHYKPWTYQVWKKPVAGWCSWFAYFNNVDEEKIHHVADVLSEKLAPYGLEYLQIDDGYQQEPAGLPETWNHPNNKFPSGLENLSHYIAGKGLKPGIWTYISFNQKDFATSHPDFFLHDREGKPFHGRWIGYPIDGSNPEAIDTIIRPTYMNFVNTGWKYFKADGLRHLRYEGYNSHATYFKNRQINLEQSYRKTIQAIRDEIGKDNFLLGCWGPRPELTGIIDGCRIGGDGFGYASLTQFNSFNNVVWRNDPDHIVLSEKEAYRSCMTTSLTGSLFMLTDKPEVYETERIEAAKRSLPVLFTLPGQLYDVDPSRSMNLDQIASTLSGDREKVFEGSRTSPYNLFLLEINRPWERWMVLGRTEAKKDVIHFRELGLKPGEEYLVFEFWTKTFLGSFAESFKPGPINAKYNNQVFCIRRKTGHPQVLATNRHISCGAVELSNVSWQADKLSGESKLVAGDPYELYIFEPENFTLKDYHFKGEKLIHTSKKGSVSTFKVISDTGGSLKWEIRYHSS